MDRWTCQIYMDGKKDREIDIKVEDWRKGNTDREKKRYINRLCGWQFVMLSLRCQKGLECELWTASTLTFLLPSVTVRGTGMGGHLLRFGGGFSLFQRMMIWSIKHTQIDALDWLEIVADIQKLPFVVTLYFILSTQSLAYLPVSSILIWRPLEVASWLAETERPMERQRGWQQWTLDLEWPLSKVTKNNLRVKRGMCYIFEFVLLERKEGRKKNMNSYLYKTAGSSHQFKTTMCRFF